MLTKDEKRKIIDAVHKIVELDEISMVEKAERLDLIIHIALARAIALGIHNGMTKDEIISAVSDHVEDAYSRAITAIKKVQNGK